jgi:hypothetical protein
MRPVLAGVALVLLLGPGLPSPAGAHHVPVASTVVELPPTEGTPGWVCVGGFFTTKYVQQGERCEFWCVTDGGCAIFYTDIDYVEPFPFEVTFRHLAGHVERRGPTLEGYVCIRYFEMADLHYTFFPGRVAPGTVGHVFGVKDEGQFCPW